MSGRLRRTERDERRRSYGQNFLVDRPLIERWIGELELGSDDLVVDLGAGSGALTRAIVATGALVWAVESDPAWADRLRREFSVERQIGSVRVIEADIRRLRLPREPYRVVANPPFAVTTELLGLLLDRPERGPSRADLVLQREVARKHATSPPTALRTAGWVPWWDFSLGATIPRTSFRPIPSVDAAVLTIRRRVPALLPERLAPTFAERLRPDWNG